MDRWVASFDSFQEFLRQLEKDGAIKNLTEYKGISSRFRIIQCREDSEYIIERCTIRDHETNRLNGGGMTVYFD